MMTRSFARLRTRASDPERYPPVPVKLGIPQNGQRSVVKHDQHLLDICGYPGSETWEGRTVGFLAL